MEITTLNDLYKVNKWLEPAVKVSNDCFNNLDENVDSNRENWKQICETVVLIKSVCKTEKVPDKVYFTMLDEAFNKRLTKDMRSKALKFGGYAKDCIKYLESIKSTASSIDRMTVVYDKHLKSLKNADRTEYEKSPLARDFGYKVSTEKPLTNKDIWQRIEGGNKAFFESHTLLTFKQIELLEAKYQTNLAIIREYMEVKKAA